MSLNRWDPLRDLLNLQERVSRLIDASAEEGVCRPTACWCPPVDVIETEDGYVFRSELPGVGRENISIEVRGNRLTLSGTRPRGGEPVVTCYHRLETLGGIFERTFTLPGDVDVENASAKYVDGVLEVYLPKAREEQKHTVTIVSVA